MTPAVPRPERGGLPDRLPLTWLVTCVYTLLHAAADDVNTGQPAQKNASQVLEATILSALVA